MQHLEAPLFRGATRPVMFLGVPMNALIVVTLPCLLAVVVTSEWIGLAAILFLIPAALAIFAMRQMTKRDDQYLNMWLLELQERISWLSKNKYKNITIVPPVALRHRRFIED